MLAIIVNECIKSREDGRDEVRRTGHCSVGGCELSEAEEIKGEQKALLADETIANEIIPDEIIADTIIADETIADTITRLCRRDSPGVPGTYYVRSPV